MKVAVIGSREFSNKTLLFEALDKLQVELHSGKIDLIISGGTKGTDHLAEQYAIEKNISTKFVFTSISNFWTHSSFKKNIQIIENSQLVVAFWDGSSPGTRFSIAEANARNIKVITIRF